VADCSCPSSYPSSSLLPTTRRGVPFNVLLPYTLRDILPPSSLNEEIDYATLLRELAGRIEDEW